MCKEVVETITGTKATVRIYQDNTDCVEDPIHECNPKELDKAETLLVSFHRRYGKDHGLKTPEDVLEFATEHGMHAFAVRAYDHGGIALTLVEDRVDASRPFPSRENLKYPFNDQWDSGWYGFLLITNEFDGTKNETRKGLFKDLLDDERRHKMFESAKSLLETYSQWNNGEIYGYRAFDAEGNEIDSCWGYIGLENIKEEAKTIAGVE